MNAKVGEENWDYDKVMGKHGLGQRNDNGERVCEFCCMNELVTTGTLVPHKNIHKATCMGISKYDTTTTTSFIYISL